MVFLSLIKENILINLITEIRDKLGYAPDSIIYDNKYHRFATSNRSKLNGFYKTDGKFCHFGDWAKSSSYHINFSSIQDEYISNKNYIHYSTRFSDEEIERIRSEFLSFKTFCPRNHPYIVKKGLSSAHGAMLDETKSAIVIPFFDINGEVSGFERIFPNGDKRIAKGSKKKGSYTYIKGDQINLACEGFATGCSIFEATGHSVIICIDAGNLVHGILTASTALGINPSEVTIIADNDKSRTGEIKAEEALIQLGCSYIIIPEQGLDANDYASKYGLDALRRIINGE